MKKQTDPKMKKQTDPKMKNCLEIFVAVYNCSFCIVLLDSAYSTSGVNNFLLLFYFYFYPKTRNSSQIWENINNEKCWKIIIRYQREKTEDYINTKKSPPHNCWCPCPHIWGGTAIKKRQSENPTIYYRCPEDTDSSGSTSDPNTWDQSHLWNISFNL